VNEVITGAAWSTRERRRKRDKLPGNFKIDRNLDFPVYYVKIETELNE